MNLPKNGGEWFALSICAAIAATSLITLAALIKNWLGRRWVRATVTGHEQSRDPEGGNLFRTALQYDDDGKTLTCLDDFWFGWKVHKPGEQLWVGLPANAQGQAMVWRIWPALLIMAVFGAGVAGVTALLR